MSEEKDGLSLSDDEDDEFDEDGHLPEIQGTLMKWTNYIHGWQDRFIVLKDGTLSYYKSENDTSFGCRGAISLSKASIVPHQFDECRFDVSVNDSVWYLRGVNEEERQHWISMLELHKQADSGYGSENNLRRHGSMMSLTSATSLSTASASSFKRGRGLREKLAEMETFRDILCRQVDTLQSYFDSCASAVVHGTVHDLADQDDMDEPYDYDQPNSTTPTAQAQGTGLKGNDLASLLQQHGRHSIDFKGEAFTFKATTAGILSTLTHCIELMAQREDAWRKRLEREVEKRKKIQEVYKLTVADKAKPIVVGGPDYEEGPHCAINEDEFFDAVDATLDKLENEEERRRAVKKMERPPVKIALSPSSPYYNEINQVVGSHLKHMDEMTEEGESTWTLIHEEGELKVYKREIEENGIVLDPLKAVHTVKGITGHEVCHYFWDIGCRMEWEGTIDSSEVVEWLSEDTNICHNVIKRVWPASQRDAVFWSHIRHVPSMDDEGPDRWIVVNYSTDHPSAPSNKYVRVKMNVAMTCQTVIHPPSDGNICRDDIQCKISYTANVNPGGWAPATVLRQVYKREYPKFVKRFTQYVKDKTAELPILF
ncbi:ceramide transfer protein-like [Liolophura sinensis]|uniref:ceramide transfer protein-like n=1 Tax=Liolophura sinensis TaxID=3198878 RepID=UPI003157FD45